MCSAPREKTIEGVLQYECAKESKSEQRYSRSVHTFEGEVDKRLLLIVIG